MAYATIADIEARLGRELDESEEQIVTARLNDVELLILARIPNLAELIECGKTSEALVAMVEADAVMRILKNPDGIVGETDGNYSYQLNWAVVTGRLSILPEEWRLLGVRRSIFLIAPTLPTPCKTYPHDCSPSSCGCEGSESQYPDGQAVWWSD